MDKKQEIYRQNMGTNFHWALVTIEGAQPLVASLLEGYLGNTNTLVQDKAFKEIELLMIQSERDTKKIDFGKIKSYHTSLFPILSRLNHYPQICDVTLGIALEEAQTTKD